MTDSVEKACQRLANENTDLRQQLEALRAEHQTFRDEVAAKLENLSSGPNAAKAASSGAGFLSTPVKQSFRAANSPSTPSKLGRWQKTRGAQERAASPNLPLSVKSQRKVERMEEQRELNRYATLRKLKTTATMQDPSENTSAIEGDDLQPTGAAAPSRLNPAISSNSNPPSSKSSAKRAPSADQEKPDAGTEDAADEEADDGVIDDPDSEEEEEDADEAESNDDEEAVEDEERDKEPEVKAKSAKSGTGKTQPSGGSVEAAKTAPLAGTAKASPNKSGGKVKAVKTTPGEVSFSEYTGNELMGTENAGAARVLNRPINKNSRRTAGVWKDGAVEDAFMEFEQAEKSGKKMPKTPDTDEPAEDGSVPWGTLASDVEEESEASEDAPMRTITQQRMLMRSRYHVMLTRVGGKFRSRVVAGAKGMGLSSDGGDGEEVELRVGDHIVAVRGDGTAREFKATVTDINEKGTISVEWEDGYRAKQVINIDDIRDIDVKMNEILPGDRIQARRGKSVCTALIKTVNDDGTVTVDWSDGKGVGYVLHSKAIMKVYGIDEEDDLYENDQDGENQKRSEAQNQDHRDATGKISGSRSLSDRMVLGPAGMSFIASDRNFGSKLKASEDQKLLEELEDEDWMSTPRSQVGEESKQARNDQYEGIPEAMRKALMSRSRASVAITNKVHQAIDIIPMNQDLTWGEFSRGCYDRFGRHHAQECHCGGNYEGVSGLCRRCGKKRGHHLPRKGEQATNISWTDDLYELCRPLLDSEMKLNHSQQQYALRAVAHRLKTPPWNWNGPGVALKAAVDSGNSELVYVMLQAGMNPDEPDNRGVAPLHSAAFNGRADMCRILLDGRAKVNVRDRHGQTPIFFAPDTKVCRLLLEFQADLSAVNFNGQSALHFAARAGLRDVLTWLEQRAGKATVDIRDVHGATATNYLVLSCPETADKVMTPSSHCFTNPGMRPGPFTGRHRLPEQRWGVKNVKLGVADTAGSLKGGHGPWRFSSDEVKLGASSSCRPSLDSVMEEEEEDDEHQEVPIVLERSREDQRHTRPRSAPVGRMDAKARRAGQDASNPSARQARVRNHSRGHPSRGASPACSSASTSLRKPAAAPASSKTAARSNLAQPRAHAISPAAAVPPATSSMPSSANARSAPSSGKRDGLSIIPKGPAGKILRGGGGGRSTTVTDSSRCDVGEMSSGEPELFNLCEQPRRFSLSESPGVSAVCSPVIDHDERELRIGGISSEYDALDQYWTGPVGTTVMQQSAAEVAAATLVAAMALEDEGVSGSTAGVLQELRASGMLDGYPAFRATSNEDASKALLSSIADMQSGMEAAPWVPKISHHAECWVDPERLSSDEASNNCGQQDIDLSETY